MKKIRLLFAAMLVASAASAQNNYGSYAAGGEYKPTVYLISVNEVNDYTSDGSNCCGAAEAAALNRATIANAIQDYNETHRCGFQQAQRPQFIFATKNNRFSLAMGGSVTMRAGYDFDGSVQNIDFVPADIPVPGSYATQQKLMMDATTSRLFLKAITNTSSIGRVVVFAEADFRGSAAYSYVPRVRSAYVSFGGFTFGRDVTTFCDLNAAPETIDYEGPNAYNFEFNTMVRYEISFLRDVMTFGVAAEMPKVSGTYNANFAQLSQRVPDFPAYLQAAWGRNRLSHIRASAVVRNMYVRNLRTNANKSIFGWGVQGSGRINLGRALDLFFNGVYGEGISPYIQDLKGIGLDFTPNPENAEQLQATPMYGWQAAAQINLVPKRLSLSGGFSAVTVCKKNGFYADDEYRQGQYIFGNIFWHLSPRCILAGEYLYGRRQNMDHMKNHANRVNMMVQYNF